MRSETLSVGAEKARPGIFGKTIFSVLFLTLAIVIAHYKGVYLGIIAGSIFSWWLYQNAFRHRRKTHEDILYEQEIEAERNLFRPYFTHWKVFLGLIVIANGVLFMVTQTWAPLFILDMIGVISGLLFLVKVKSDANTNEQETMAHEMGFSFLATGDVSSIPEKLQALGKNSRIAHVFSGTMEGYSVRIFDFYYQWMKQAAYETTLLEITNIRKCPNMFILSKRSTFGDTFDVTRVFPGVAVRLEGNFSDYFSLFVENSAEDEIRQLLAPDLMAVLIDTMPDLSFMFFENKIYVVLSDNSGHGFLKGHFAEQVNKARFIITKWSLTLSKMDFSR